MFCDRQRWSKNMIIITRKKRVLTACKILAVSGARKSDSRREYKRYQRESIYTSVYYAVIIFFIISMAGYVIVYCTSFFRFLFLDSERSERHWFYNDVIFHYVCIHKISNKSCTPIFIQFLVTIYRI